MSATSSEDGKLPKLRNLLVDEKSRILSPALNPRPVLDQKEIDPVLTTQVCWCGKMHDYGAFCARPGEEDRAHLPFCDEE